MPRLTLVLAFVLLANALAFPALAQRGGPANVFAATVEERVFANRIEALGTLEPRERVDLSLNAADRVTAVYFDDGERVVEGQTLLSLAQREQSALVEAAEATLAEARSQLERIAPLVEDGAVSELQYDEARRDVDSAAANLRAVQSRQRDRVLVAPFNGVLGFRRVSVGSYIRPGDVVATLIDDSEMRLEFPVPSIFLTTLSVDMPIEARTDDLPGRTFSGTVTSLDNAIDPVTRSVRVRATLPNEDRALKAGMFMLVDLAANPRRALAIPEEAVEPQGPLFFVYVLDSSEQGLIARRQEVSLGMRSEGYIEVLSGLQAGDRIVTEGLLRVRNGIQVRVRDPDLLTPTGEPATAAGELGPAPG